MEGLEADEVKLSIVRSSSEELRIDSNYFHSDELLKRIASFSGRPLAELSIWVTQGPNPIMEEEGTEGIPCLTGRNIRGHVISTEDADIVSAATFDEHPKFHLHKGDILVTLKGAGSTGKMALVDKDMPMMFSRNVGLVRLKAENHELAEFLYAYFSCRHGQKLIDRGVTGGTGQLTLPTGYLKRFPIPSFPVLSARIKAIVSQGKHQGDEADIHYKVAEEALLKALGLENWRPPEPLTYTRRASEALAAKRIDSDFFAPRVSQLLETLSRDGLTLGDVAPVRHEGFDPTKEKTDSFDYIEIGGLRSDGTCTAEIVPLDEAPSRANQHVRSGDIITSTVRPIRRLSALIQPDQNGYVCSSGFVVLEPKDIASEVLLTYLRLPIFCNLMDLHTSASLYPAISEKDLLKLPIPKIAKVHEAAIIEAVQSAHTARKEAQELLERAKRAVEIAIEEDEPAALKYLKD